MVPSSGLVDLRVGKLQPELQGFHVDCLNNSVVNVRNWKSGRTDFGRDVDEFRYFVVVLTTVVPDYKRETRSG